MTGVVKINKYSPRAGFMHDMIPVEVTLTKKAANKRKYLLTKSNRSNGMDFEELIGAVKAHEAGNESELVATLKSQGVSEKGIEVAKTFARMADAYSDEVSAETLALAINVTPGGDEGAAGGEAISKSELEKLPESIRKSVERILDENAGLSDKVDTLASEFAKTAGERKLASYVAKAADLGSLSGTADDIGAVLKSISDSAGDEAANSVLEILRSANEVAASVGGEVFKSHGSTEEGTSDVYATVEGKARELMQKSADLSLSAAMQRVFADNPELAKQYNG